MEVAHTPQLVPPSPARGSSARRLLPVLHLFAFGSALLALAGAAIAAALHLGAIGPFQRTQGTVIGLMEMPATYRRPGTDPVARPTYCPEVRYQTADGRRFYGFLVSQCAVEPRYRTGEALPLDYDRRTPHKPLIDARARFLGIALVFAAVAGLLGAIAWATRSRRRAIRGAA